MFALLNVASTCGTSVDILTRIEKRSHGAKRPELRAVPQRAAVRE